MTFVQIVECKTSRVDELNQLMDSWVAQSQGRRTATHSMVGTDRKDSNHVVEIVEFPSYEAAMRNSNLPETDRIFHEMVALCDEPPTFTDLDVVRDEQLNTATAKRALEEISKGRLELIDELFDPGYVGHDPAADGDTVGLDALRTVISGYTNGFDMTMSVDQQFAEGDRVVCQWHMSALHTGEFMGLPATHKNVEVTGTTIVRFQDGKIAEDWWQWDNLGMLRQLGMVRM